MIRRTTLALLLTLAALLTPATTQAGFAPEGEVLGSGKQFSVADMAMDGSGTTIVVWDDEQPGAERNVGARFVSVGGNLGPQLTLSPSGTRSTQPVVAMSPSGRAFVAWRSGPAFDPSDVIGRWVEPDGSLGPLLTLEEGSAEDEIEPVELRASIDPAGVASVAWRNGAVFGDYALGLRRVSPAGELSPTLAELPAGGVELEIAALPSGATALVSRASEIELALVGPNLEVAAPVDLSAGAATAPEIAVDALGRGLVVWREKLESPFPINGIRLSPDGVPVGAVLTIDSGESGSPSSWGVSADSDGDFLVSWTRFNLDGEGTVQVRGVNSAGALGPPPSLLSDGDVESVRTALFDDGTAAIAWAEEFPGEEKEPLRLGFGRAIETSGSPLGAIAPLGAGAMRIGAAAPALGVASFAFTEYTDEGSVGRLRRYLPPPTCTDSALRVDQGQSAAAALACTGLAIEGFRVVGPPLHGTLSSFSAAGRSITYTPRPDFSGTDAFAFVAVSDGGESNVARVAIDVEKDTQRPRIASIRLRHGPVGKSKPPVTTYRFELQVSEPALATVLVEKPLRGVRKGRRCLKPKPGLSGKRCTRYRKVGRVSADRPGTSLELTIRGKLDRKISQGGRFRATATATDIAGNSSAPRKRTFRFMRKRPNGKVSSRHSAANASAVDRPMHGQQQTRGAPPHQP